METTQFYTVKELSEILHLHQQTVIRMIKRGELNGTLLAGKWRIPQSELDKIKELCGVR
jgi:excisionase family DNA binding protein